MNKMQYELLKTLDRSFIRMYVFIRALYCNVKTYEGINVVLDKYENIIKAKHCNFKFTFFYDCMTVQESMSLTRTKTIVANPAWAAKLVLLNNSEIETVFLITSGHEMTHNEAEFSTSGFRGKNKKFINWVNEVHADFGGAEKMAQSSKEKLINSISYKIRVKPNNQESSTHPSWKQRMNYAKTGVFNKALIETIAEQTGCTNNKLINDISKFYGEIVLKD